MAIQSEATLELTAFFFEEEEPIDIKAVMAEIKELETKRADLDKEIEGQVEMVNTLNYIQKKIELERQNLRLRLRLRSFPSPKLFI